MRYSKAVRARAIEALEFACSDVGWSSSPYENIRRHASGHALDLATAAFAITPTTWLRSPTLDDAREEMMEAAGLLRDGWSTGQDLVETRTHASRGRGPTTQSARVPGRQVK